MLKIAMVYHSNQFIQKMGCLSIFQPKNCFEKDNNVFVFYIISVTWDDTGSSSPTMQKSVDDLARDN